MSPPTSSLFETWVQQLDQLISSGRLTAYENEVPVVLWRDELGRLRIWANEAQLSEVRLRDAFHIREQLFRILRRLQRALADMQEVLHNNAADEAMSDMDSDDDDVDGTEMQMIYRSLRDTINCLFNMTMVILQPVHHPLVSHKVVGLPGYALVEEASSDKSVSAKSAGLAGATVAGQERARIVTQPERSAAEEEHRLRLARRAVRKWMRATGFEPTTLNKVEDEKGSRRRGLPVLRPGLRGRLPSRSSADC